MTPDMYKRMTLAEMQQKRWRTAIAIENKRGRIEAGREVVIVNKRGGLDLSSPSCPHCGVCFFVRGCHPSSVEEIT